ncbi:exodeoxyribonuclease VII large subunit [Alicyclobacillus sp. SO9]|uniref:exodeoxyribonuclease VII large subunit n=1 Tax=Alicyclobacillus sp. SO9 TaxID=2665646 RepID=UPI001E56CCAF|nr:exodeoxyribonuclease VII large subunit [Alicyclobacillus sp. SO9]
MTQPPQVITVSQLTSLIKHRIETDPRLLNCTVTGEISNFKHHSSGHMYLTLKDESSRVRAIMFSSKNRRLSFRPEDGMRVIATGNVGVFDRDGQVQLYIESMQPDGVGALYVAFSQLKEKLSREGLFDAQRKKTLARYPMVVGVATSPTGSVIKDICSTLERRYPLAKVVLAPASVQGPGAAKTIVKALRQLQAYDAGVRRLDVVIIARGGGSLEELWPFNEEAVARAVAACPIPVVSAVGHETDFTIADFVADVRAATPTAAAEVIAPSLSELSAAVEQYGERAAAALKVKLKSERQRMQSAAQSSVLRNPLRLIDLARQNVDYLESRTAQAVVRPLETARRRLHFDGERLYRIDLSRRIERYRSRLERAAYTIQSEVNQSLSRNNNQLTQVITQLEGLNPLSILKRGYSVVTQANGDIVHSTKQVRPSESISVRVADGTIRARVKSIGQEGDERGEFEQSRLNI